MEQPPPSYEDPEWQRQQFINQKREIVLWSSTSLNLSHLANSASRTQKLGYFLIFLVGAHGIISLISLYCQQKGHVVDVTTRFGTFQFVYAALNILICGPLIPSYYQHRVACARSTNASDPYIKGILSIARLAVFVECSAFADINTLAESSAFIQKLRIISFFRGAQIVIFCCFLLQWEAARRVLRRFCLWEHGKILVLVALMFAASIFIMTQQDGEIKVKDDYGMNELAMGLLGAIYGFVGSIIMDWTVLHSSLQLNASNGEHIELRGT
jgi:hypothetical protein